MTNRQGIMFVVNESIVCHCELPGTTSFTKKVALRIEGE